MGTHKIHQQPALVCKSKPFKSVKISACCTPRGLVSTQVIHGKQPGCTHLILPSLLPQSKPNPRNKPPLLSQQNCLSALRVCGAHEGRPGLAVSTELPSLARGFNSINARLHSTEPQSARAGHKVQKLPGKHLIAPHQPPCTGPPLLS